MKRKAMIIGAGMAGLSAGRLLKEADWEVVLVDKGRGVGGRVATRRVGREGRVDHGAQFFTAREEPLLSWAEQHASLWWDDRYVVPGGMNTLAKSFAEGLEIHREERVMKLLKRQRWSAVCESGKLLSADAVILTSPVPQSLQMLSTSGVAYPKALEDIRYDPCLAVLAEGVDAADWPELGVREFAEGPVAWAADNQRKGASEEATMTLHATPKFSAEHFRADREAAGQQMLDAAGVCANSFSVHGWLYARPLSIYPDLAPVISEDPPLVLAGDAFHSPRVEGAVLSGRAAAKRLLKG